MLIKLINVLIHLIRLLKHFNWRHYVSSPIGRGLYLLRDDSSIMDIPGELLSILKHLYSYYRVASQK